jgi:hypothetical protein
MDSTVDVLSEQLWGKSYSEIHEGFTMNSYRGSNTPTSFRSQFKLIKDSKKGYWKRGDIVKFSTGFFAWKFDRVFPWKKWFLKKKDYLRSLEESEFVFPNNRVPKYARLEYGMILSRYKWIKFKTHGKFYDYGSIIMTLTGSKPGKIRRYYLITPYEFVSRFPYDSINPFHKKNGLKEIPEGERIHKAMSYANDKNQFILNIVASFHDRNYPENMENQNEFTTENNSVV